MTSFHIYNHLPFIQELIGDEIRLIQITSGVAAKVKHELGHTLVH